MLLAVLGTLVLAFMGAALGRVALVTTLGMGAGAVAAMSVSAYWQGKPDPLWMANGLLAGLVAVTGAVPHVTWWGGLLVGGLGGALVLPAYQWTVDSLQIDDVCGVFAVHGAAGGVGTVLIPLFAASEGGVPVLGDGWAFLGVDQLAMQVAGVLVIGTWTVLATGAVLLALDALVGLRVSEAAEEAGLDVGEHGISTYPEFVGSDNPESGRPAVSTDGGTEDARTDRGTASTTGGDDDE